MDRALSGLAKDAPSSWAAACLEDATTDPALLPTTALIDAMTAWHRQAAFALARRSEIVAEFVRRHPDTEHGSRFAFSTNIEVGMALTLSPGTATGVMDDAARLATELLGTRYAWAAARWTNARFGRSARPP